jgi:predicted enzyme related to lactoylglutathione lyase
MAAYVDPQTGHNPASGAVAPSSWGDQVRNALDWLRNPPKCLVYNSAAIAVPTNTETALTFNSERFDTDTMHSTSVNTGRITFTTAGTYLVGGSIRWADAASTAAQRLAIRLNGTTKITEALNNHANNGGSPLEVGGRLYPFSAGDYIELVAYQNTGGTINVTATGNQSPEFWAIWQSL